MAVVAVLAGHRDAYINATDIAGRTALHWAAAFGHTAVVNELWCRSTNVQHMDHGGWTGAPNCLLCATPPHGTAQRHAGLWVARQQLNSFSHV